MLFWIKVSYLGVMTVPTLWLVFALQYTGRDRCLTRRNVILLFILPVIVILANWTNESHRLFYSNFYVDSTGPFPRFALERGPLYWLSVINSYLSLLSATVFLVIMFVRATYTYRRQISVILLGAAFPWIANILYLTVNPFPYLNLTPLSFVTTGFIIAWGVFRHRLLDVVPVARDKVVEGMRDGVIVLDAQARVVDINPIAEHVIGRPESEVIGLTVTDILSGQLESAVHDYEAEDIQTQITLENTAGLRYYDVHSAPLYGRRGVLAGWVIVLHDITERRQAEHVLQQRTQELETRNAELDAFAHTVAHDLKSPLTVMIGFSMLMESQIDTISRENLYANLNRISKTGNKMTNIIDELLLLASVREMQDVEFEPLDMAAIIHEALDRLRDSIAETQATILVPKSWPVAIGYAPWVEEIWTNYISNALKYGGRPAEGLMPHIELGFDLEPERMHAGEQGSKGAGESNTSAPLLPRSSASTHIRFWVRDNGPGLTDAQRAQLFTEFTRLHEARAEGHGLGLSIVRRIADKLGGEVGVESELGHGSTFSFTLQASVESGDSGDGRW
jgi:PAS domain S-box-containing protein